MITPSLDETVHTATELSVKTSISPLIIGGATTSKAHTAVKMIRNIKCCGSCTTLPEQLGSKFFIWTIEMQKFVSELKTDYADFREKFLNRQVDKEYISIEEARNQKIQNRLGKKKKKKKEEIFKPKIWCSKIIENQDLEELIDFIWLESVFQKLICFGKYPQILKIN